MVQVRLENSSSYLVYQRMNKTPLQWTSVFHKMYLILLCYCSRVWFIYATISMSDKSSQLFKINLLVQSITHCTSKRCFLCWRQNAAWFYDFSVQCGEIKTIKPSMAVTLTPVWRCHVWSQVDNNLQNNDKFHIILMFHNWLDGSSCSVFFKAF